MRQIICECDICGSDSETVIGTDARSFKVRGQLISVIYTVYRCKNGHIFHDCCGSVMNESDMSDFQRLKFREMSESKTHFTHCSHSSTSGFYPFYDGRCEMCDEDNKNMEKQCEL